MNVNSQDTQDAHGMVQKPFTPRQMQVLFSLPHPVLESSLGREMMLCLIVSSQVNRVTGRDPLDLVGLVRSSAQWCSATSILLDIPPGSAGTHPLKLELPRERPPRFSGSKESFDK